MIILNEAVTVVVDRDWFVILVTVINILILVITAIAVYRAPIKAQEIGINLTKKQKRNDEKMNLFLRLFALRGNPLDYGFVLGLNQIEIVFQDNQEVINAWQSLRMELEKPDSEEQSKNLMERTNNLLTKMGQELGYSKLHDSIKSNHYYPKGFSYQAERHFQLQEFQIDYYRKGIKLYELMMSNHKDIEN
jgi:hypothetical protein